MKEKLINISFLAAGHIIQDIVLAPDSPYTAQQVVNMLNTSEAFTTVHEDNDVILPDGTVIGTIRYSDTELEYSGFQVESGDYELDAPKPFDASRLARACAIGEYVFEPEMDIKDIMATLEAASGMPPKLTMENNAIDMTGRELLKLIDLDERGLMNLMNLAYAAGKNGQEII